MLVILTPRLRQAVSPAPVMRIECFHRYVDCSRLATTLARGVIVLSDRRSQIILLERRERAVLEVVAAILDIIPSFLVDRTGRLVRVGCRFDTTSAEAGMAAASIEGLFISWSSSITGLSVWIRRIFLLTDRCRCAYLECLDCRHCCFPTAALFESSRLGQTLNR
jgi:hypothetical protein